MDSDFFKTEEKYDNQYARVEGNLENSKKQYERFKFKISLDNKHSVYCLFEKDPEFEQNKKIIIKGKIFEINKSSIWLTDCEIL